MEDTESVFVKRMFNDVLSNDFAFMMLEGNEALRDAFSAAIADIRADGTLTRLVADHIDAAITGKNIAPVEMPKIDGAETVRVAITDAYYSDYFTPVLLKSAVDANKAIFGAVADEAP